MHDKPPGIRRLCVAFGIEPSGERDGAERTSAQQRVAEAITGVCTSLGLDRMLLNRSAEDGEQIGLLPVGIDEPRVVSSLVEGLSSALAELDVPPGEGGPVRLRVAFHEGVTTLAADGFGGRAVTKVHELAGSPHLRAALDEHPSARLAVVLSDPVFEGVGHCDYPGLPADQFQPVEIADAGPAPASTAWIYVPA